MRLTKKRRLEAYTYALFCALDKLDNKEQHRGICVILYEWEETVLGYTFSEEDMETAYPEFMVY